MSEYKPNWYENLKLLAELQRENDALRAYANLLNGELAANGIDHPYGYPRQSIAEIEAAAVEKYFTKLQKEYEPYSLLKTYTAFDVAKHIGAQGKHFAEQIRQQATGDN